VRDTAILRRVTDQSRTSPVRTVCFPLAEKCQTDGIVDADEGEGDVRMQAFHTQRVTLPRYSNRGTCVVPAGLGGAPRPNGEVRLGEACP
jgi:hypothetical protein